MRTYIIEMPDDEVFGFEHELALNSYGKIVAHADNFNARAFISMMHLPVNRGTWDENGKFHGSTNYSGEAVRCVLTLEPRQP